MGDRRVDSNHQIETRDQRCRVGEIVVLIRPVGEIYMNDRCFCRRQDQMSSTRRSGAKASRVVESVQAKPTLSRPSFGHARFPSLRSRLIGKDIRNIPRDRLVPLFPAFRLRWEARRKSRMAHPLAYPSDESRQSPGVRESSRTSFGSHIRIVFAPRSFQQPKKTHKLNRVAITLLGVKQQTLAGNPGRSKAFARETKSAAI